MAYDSSSPANGPPRMFKFAAKYAANPVNNGHRSSNNHHPALSTPSNAYSQFSGGHKPAANRYGYSVVGRTDDPHLNSKRRNERSRSFKRSGDEFRHKRADDDYEDEEMTADSLASRRRFRKSQEEQHYDAEDKPSTHASQPSHAMKSDSGPKKGKDVLIHRFKPQNFPTGYTMSLYGGSGSGKTTTLFNFVSMMRHRFAILIVFSYTVGTLEMYQDITFHQFTIFGFRPDIMMRVLDFLERCHKQFNIRPTVAFVLDDLFLEDGVSKDPIWKSLYRKCRHLGVQIFEGKHAVTDTVRGNKDSIHLVGLVGGATGILKDAVWKDGTFDGMFDCRDDFETALFKATKGGTPAAALLLDKSRGPPRLCYFHAKDKTEMLPFSVGHPDLFAAMFMFGINDVPNQTIKANPRAKKLRDIPAYQKLLGIHSEDTQEDRVPNVEEIPLTQQEKYIAKMKKLGKPPVQSELDSFGKMMLIDD